MDNTSREDITTDHALRVLVRIDTRQGLACLEVRGCLTTDTLSTLVNILAHTGALGAAVSVNLLRAAHVDAGALRRLLAGADSAVHADPDRASTAPVEILVPPVLPFCRPGPGASARPEPVAQPAPPQPAPLQPAPPQPGPEPLQSASPQPSPLQPADRPAPRRALTNEEAVDLAFLRRDPRVLAEPFHLRPQVL